MKKICDLFDVDYDFEVMGITDDSRLVKDGYIFVTTQGFNVDHYDYISQAISNGCKFIVTDRKMEIDFPHIIVENINECYRNLCKKYYDIDLNFFDFIGITGTDGKTTTATIVSELIDNCAYIGTNGLKVHNVNSSTNNTTPCISELYQTLAQIRDEGVSNTVMEVSSEALLHDRVANFKYNIIAFTNITGDHLNVHGSFDNYVKSKLKLLKLIDDDGIVVINGDDSNLEKIKCHNLYKIGMNDGNDFLITGYKELTKYTKIELNYNEEKYIIYSPFRGKYNVYNVVMGFAIAYLYGINPELLLKRIKMLKPISGRGEFLDFGQNFEIVLDYAHTINGIKSILETFSGKKKIITVTGCAGGREKEKRRVIGDMVIKNSDIAIFTMDDPRYENVDEIIDEMVGDEKDYIRIINREEAISYALSIADSDSVVLILGKGRDNYMAIGDKKVPYCDYGVIANYYS